MLQPSAAQGVICADKLCRDSEYGRVDGSALESGGVEIDAAPALVCKAVGFNLCDILDDLGHVIADTWHEVRSSHSQGVQICEELPLIPAESQLQPKPLLQIHSTPCVSMISDYEQGISATRLPDNNSRHNKRV